MALRESGDGILVRTAHLPGKVAVVLSAAIASIAMMALVPRTAEARSHGRTVATKRSRAVPLARAAQTVASQYRQLTSEVVHGYASSGERYYADGVWQNGDPSCWYCNVGAAVGASYLAKTEPPMLSIAVASLDRAIADHRLSNGSFGGNTSPAITSAAFAALLGLSYVRLAPQLDEATRTYWQQTLAGIADYLISDHDVTWYANGNINCSYAAALYFAWRATGEQKYLDAYNAELQFLVAPTGQLWVGFGLSITQQPTQADGSDGRGFLAEGSPPGWDPEYSHLQLDFLSALYSASGDPRVLRLLNLILNQELTRVNTSTFTLDASGGTRKSHIMAFTSAALPLLVIDGKRPDLAPLLPAAYARLSSEYLATLRYTQHNFYRGVALWLAPVLLASANLAPDIPPPGAAGVTSPPNTSSPSVTLTRTAAGRAVRSGAAPRLPAARPPSVSPNTPVISPNVLDATSLVQVTALEIPNLEFAFATPTTATRGVTVAGRSGKPLSFAAIACTHICTTLVRPMLVVHRRGEQSPVVVQSYLATSHVTLHAGELFISRVLMPRTAFEAVRRGHSVFVRLILSVRTRGRPLQMSSAMFKVLWR